MFYKRHFGKIHNYLIEKIEKDGGLLFVLLDPEKADYETAKKIGKICEEENVDSIIVGGSLGAEGEQLDETVKGIKENTNLPVILFPGNVGGLSKYADALYYLYELNSLDPYFISGSQILGTYSTLKYNLEVLPTAYLIFEPGRAVGWVSRAHPIPRDIPYLGVASALAGQFMGAHFVILESGSGAPSPVPTEIVRQIYKLLDIPIVVAGGVKTPELAKKEIEAGASIIHVGSALEGGKEEELKKRISSFVKAIKDGGKKKIQSIS